MIPVVMQTSVYELRQQYEMHRQDFLSRPDHGGMIKMLDAYCDWHRARFGVSAATTDALIASIDAKRAHAEETIANALKVKPFERKAAS